MTQYLLEPIGYIQTCFPEKFGIPRQPLLVPSAKATLRLEPPYQHPDYVIGLAGASHIWLSFIFHQHQPSQWAAKVRPPRLGGNEKKGVFATRSSYRPNSLGLSAVKLEAVDTSDGRVCLQLSGVDLVDGTPIVDIKPYLPYADKVLDAHHAFSEDSPPLLEVRFSQTVALYLEKYQQLNGMDLKQLIIEVLQQDPRPAYHSGDEERVYGMKLLTQNVRWKYIVGEQCETIIVVDIKEGVRQRSV